MSRVLSEGSSKAVEKSLSSARPPIRRRLGYRSEAIEEEQMPNFVERSPFLQPERGQENGQPGASTNPDQAYCSFDEIDLNLDSSFDDNEEERMADVVKEFAESVQASFAQLKNDFTRYGRLLEAGTRDSGSLTLPCDSPHANDWIKSLSTTEAGELLEAETLKRRLCERKLSLLQTHIVSLEQQLELSKSVVCRQQTSLNALEVCVRHLTDQLGNFEQSRASFVGRATRTNRELIRRIQRLSDYCRISDQNLEVATERINALQKLNVDLQTTADEQLSTIQVTEKTLAAKKDECRRFSEEATSLRRENDDLRKELSSLRAVESGASRQLELVEAKHRSERSSLERQLESAQASLRDMQQQHASSIAEANKNFKLKIQELMDSLSKRKYDEIRALQDGWNSAIDKLKSKCGLLAEERDLARKSLRELEESLESRQEAMYSVLKERLSVKYYELICEMSNHGSSSTRMSSSRPALAGDGNESLEDQFLTQMSKMSLIKTPRYGTDDHNGDRTTLISQHPLMHSTPVKGAPTDPQV